MRFPSSMTSLHRGTNMAWESVPWKLLRFPPFTKCQSVRPHHESGHHPTSTLTLWSYALDCSSTPSKSSTLPSACGLLHDVFAICLTFDLHLCRTGLCNLVSPKQPHISGRWFPSTQSARMEDDGLESHVFCTFDCTASPVSSIGRSLS